MDNIVHQGIRHPTQIAIMSSATHSFTAMKVIVITLVRSVGRSVNQSVGIASDTVLYRAVKMKNEGRESIDTRRHWTRDRIHQGRSKSKSLSLSSHMELRYRKACRLLSLGIESACLVEATASLCAYFITTHSYVTSSHLDSPDLTLPHSISPYLTPLT